MNRRLFSRKMMGLGVASLLLVGCAGSPQITSEPAPQPAPTNISATATPDPCTGWSCTLSGVVYVGAVGPDNGLAGVSVELSHVTYCSPTRGQHKTTTDIGGGFSFEVFLHDTDTFRIQVERDGYEPVRRSVSGFDCLYCVCPPLDIVLQPLDTLTTAP